MRPAKRDFVTTGELLLIPQPINPIGADSFAGTDGGLFASSLESKLSIVREAGKKL